MSRSSVPHRRPGWAWPLLVLVGVLAVPLVVHARSRHRPGPGRSAAGESSPGRPRASLPPTRTTSTTWTRPGTVRSRSRRMRSRGATPGSSGRPATIGCGTRSATTASARSTSSRSCPRIRRSSTAGPATRPGWPTAAVRTGGSTSAWSTSRASRRPRRPTRTAWGCGSTSGRPGARPIRSRTPPSTRACGSDRAASTINGKPFETGSYYGYATGIVGFRLFPNPEFDEAAARAVGRRALLHRPVLLQRQGRSCVRTASGMSCGLCHVGPNPIKPPADPNNPEWANLSSNVGAQYFWTDRIFYEAADYSSFAFQLFHSSRPGSLDTSFVSTDNINNPRTMNAVYGLLPRLLHARRWGKETLAGGGLNNKQLNDYLKAGPLAALFTAPDTVWTPRVLKDGSDSVGVDGRAEPGLPEHRHVQRGVADALQSARRRQADHADRDRRWRARTPRMYAATEAQTFDVARFFLKTTDPHKLADAPGGAALLTTDQRRAHARQGGLRGELRALPFVEGARDGDQPRFPTAASGRTTCRAGTGTGRPPRRRSSRPR